LWEIDSSECSSSRFEELENLLVLFGSQISADTHVHHDDFPLRRAIVAGRSDIVTTITIVRPKLRPAFSRRTGCNFARLIIGRATDEPDQACARNNDDGPRQADPFADFWNNRFHNLEADCYLQHEGVLISGAAIFVV